MTIDNTKCILCGGDSILVKVFSNALKDENLFGLKDKKYRRMIYNCKDCDHYFNQHKYTKKTNIKLIFIYLICLYYN